MENNQRQGLVDELPTTAHPGVFYFLLTFDVTVLCAMEKPLSDGRLLKLSIKYR